MTPMSMNQNHPPSFQPRQTASSGTASISGPGSARSGKGLICYSGEKPIRLNWSTIERVVEKEGWS